MAKRDLLIRNAAIITGCGTVHSDGYVLISGGRVESIGSSKSLKRASSATMIDAGGRYVLPGFINPHMHLYSSLARGISVGRMQSFKDVLEGLWWKLDRALSLDDVRVSAMVGALASLRAGVTTVFDHHASNGAIMGSLGTVSEAVDKVGIRASLSYEISDRNGEDARNLALDESASWLEYVRDAMGRDPGFMQRGMVGLHASMTLADDTLELAGELMDAYGVSSHVHVAEGREDVDITVEEFGRSPVARFAKSGVFRENSIAAHCVHVNSRDVALLAKNGVCVAHNPQSNLNNAVGVAPVLEMIRKGVPVAVGTDGMSAGLGCDIRLAGVIHKLACGDAQAGWEELAYMVWGVAPWLASMAFGCDVGCLRKGAAADLIVVENRPSTPLTSDNALAHFVFGVLGAPVRSAIVGGRVRMKDYRILGVDEDVVAKEAQKRAKALWRRMR